MHSCIRVFVYSCIRAFVYSCIHIFIAYFTLLSYKLSTCRTNVNSA